MKNKKYNNSKIFVICRTEGQIKYINTLFHLTVGEREAQLEKLSFRDNVCFRLINNKYQGFAHKDFYLKEYMEYEPVEFTKYFLPTFVEVDE